MQEYNFKELKAAVSKSLDKLLKQGYFQKNGDKDIKIMPGFSIKKFQHTTKEYDEVSGLFPQVVVVGKQTGTVYNFSLLALLPKVTREKLPSNLNPFTE